MRSGNPVLGADTFDHFYVYETSTTMTVQGAALKTGVLLVLAVVAAGSTWGQFVANPQAARSR